MVKIPDGYFNVFDCGWFPQNDMFSPNRNALAHVHVWFDEDGQPHAELIHKDLVVEPATPPQTCC